MVKTNSYQVYNPHLLDGVNYIGNKGPKFGTRHVQIFLLSFGIGIAFASKSMLSVAILAMTNSTSSNPDVPVYNWDDKSTVISSILWSGITVNVLAGYFGKKYGPKWFIVGASIANSLLFMLIPTSAEISGSMGVIICRIFQGLALGFLFPLNAVVQGRWVPPEERSRMGFIGSALSTVLVVIATESIGFTSKSWMGWPAIFYIFGTIELIWTVVYAIFGAQSPKGHGRISPLEKKYIHDTLFCVEDHTHTPWKEIFSSIHVWAIIIGYTGYYWTVTVFSTEMAIYRAKVLELDLLTNSTVATLPPIVGLISGVGISVLSDYIPKKGLLSVVNCRRLFHIAGTTGLAICLICITYVPVKYRIWAVVLLCIGEVFILSTAFAGAAINILDISPKYAGIVMGASQMSSQAISLFAPLTVQWICTDESNPSQWRIVFIISAVISVVPAVFFAIFASDQRQNWEEETDKEAQTEIQKKKASIKSISAGM